MSATVPSRPAGGAVEERHAESGLFAALPGRIRDERVSSAERTVTVARGKRGA